MWRLFGFCIRELYWFEISKNNNKNAILIYMVQKNRASYKITYLHYILLIHKICTTILMIPRVAINYYQYLIINSYFIWPPEEDMSLIVKATNSKQNSYKTFVTQHMYVLFSQGGEMKMAHVDDLKIQV